MPSADATPSPRRWRHLRFHGAPRTPAASSDGAGAVLKTGFLLKKGHRMPTTKDRYFVLRGDVLSYYKCARDAPAADARHLRGVLRLTPSDLITPIATSRHWLIVQQRAGSDGKPYKLELRAGSPEERQDWIDTLRRAAVDGASAPATAAQLAQQAERERRLTQTLTMLRVRDPTLLATVLGPPPPPAVDLRASFQVFHELLSLQTLVAEAQSSWGPPSTWTGDQYRQLVDAITLAASREDTSPSSVLAAARALQFAFEEAPSNQEKLLRQPQPHALHSVDMPAAVAGRLRCPTIYSYLSTFERLQEAADTASPLSPRSATLAKYASIYLEEEGRGLKPWTPDRRGDDDLLPADDGVDPSLPIAQQLAHRSAHTRVYTSLGPRVLLFVNPRRLLKTTAFTSIYDEQLVRLYSHTPFAHAHLQPHPFAVAKHALLRLRLGTATRHVLQLTGESGSGKTELAKELLKYVVLTAASSSSSSHRVVLYTSSTKSTVQMRSDERHTLDLLQAQGVAAFDVVLLDIEPARWGEMVGVSHSKRLPQLHVGGRFFGFYESLQRLQDEEQLGICLRNPHAAHQLRAVLDANLLVEAMAHAATPANANSSRYAKTVDVHVAFGSDGHHQLVGAVVTPTLLEKSRVTDSGSTNFHILYALANGIQSDGPHHQWAKALLDGKSSDDFQYLRHGPVNKTEDAKRLTHVLEAMTSVSMDAAAQEGVLRVLCAVLWLGNIQFTEGEGGVRFAGGQRGGDAVDAVVAALGLDSEAQLLSLLTRRRLAMKATNEAFAVVLSGPQAESTRDAVARALYSAAFYHVVGHLNRTTSGGAEGKVGSVLRIVDTFGFEDFGGRNSIEQLCINYLTEKLAAAEVQALVRGGRGGGGEGQREEDAVLRVFEYPLGVFATLEEQTLLHQSESEADGEEQRKNERMVRYLHQRNPQLVDTSAPLHLRALQFLVPHTRGAVRYDASNFVKKNADSVQPMSLADALASSSHGGVRAIARDMEMGGRGPPPSSSSSSTERSGSGSLASQFRTQVAALAGDVADAEFLHCLRPNSSGGATVDVPSLQRQAHAHRLPRIAAHATAPPLGELAMDASAFRSRYACLCEDPEHRGELAPLCETLDRVLHKSSSEGDGAPLLRWQPEEQKVWLLSLHVAETLELLRHQREIEAATLLQAVARRRAAERWYTGVHALRQSLARELVALYGPQSVRKVERTLRKYQGNEAALAAKIEAKRAEQRTLAELSEGMAAFASSVGVDASRLERVLGDPQVQRLVAEGEGSVLAALREMSLDPRGVLPRQLADPVLRAFYQRLLAVLQTVAETEEEGTVEEGTVAAPPPPPPPQASSVEERVQRLVATHRGVWRRVVEGSGAGGEEKYSSIRDRLEEIGDEPEMVLFYMDDAQFAEQLVAFVAEVEATVAAEGESGEGGDKEEGERRAAALVAALTRVAFTPTLMAAMRGDPYFVEALESPRLVAAVHQLMTDREAFAAGRGTLLADARLFEFFTRLVRLSETTHQ